MQFEDEPAALKAVTAGFSVENGGRGVANLLNERIIEPLSKALYKENEDDLRGSTVVVMVGPDGRFRFRVHPKET